MLRLMTGFDYYDQTKVQRVWSHYSNGTSATPGRWGGSCWQWVNQTGFLAAPIPNTAVVIVGFAFYFSNADPTNPFLVFQDATTSQTNPITQVDLRATSDGGFEVYRHGIGPPIYTSLPGLFTLNFWNFIEVKLYVSNGAGYIQVKVNGQLYVDAAALNTQYTGNQFVNMVTVQSMSATTGFTFKLDDLYILDSSGSTNNDFLGECRVQTQFPSANGETDQFQAVGASTNWQCVDETIADDDTTYTRSGTVGNLDDYAMGTISLTGTIFAVQVNVTHRKDDVGNRTIAPIIYSGGHYYPGNYFSCGSDYNVAQKIYEQEPSTLSTWTNTSVNALYAGLKIVG